MAKTQHNKQERIESLLSTLSSAYQELAIENACDYFNQCKERGEETPSEQEFRDYVCEQYRDILKSASDGVDIYKMFRRFGDETEVDYIAAKVWQILELGQTNKEHLNAIIDQAWKINSKLSKLRQECEALIEECQDHGDRWDRADFEYSLAYLVETLGDLSNIDLEDSIPERASVEY